MRSPRVLAVASAAGLAFVMSTAPASGAIGRLVMDFESLAQAGTGKAAVGLAYSEDGFNLDVAPFAFAIWQLDSPSFASSTGLYASGTTDTIELTQAGAGAFALVSIDLAPLRFSTRGLPTTVTFVGELNGVQVATQTFTTAAGRPFATFQFSVKFAHVDRVTWNQGGDLISFDLHQFDEIVLIPSETLIDFEQLAQSGASAQSVGPTYAEDGFELHDLSGGTGFSSWQLEHGRFAGSTGLYNTDPNSVTELVRQDGGAFRFVAVDLAPLNHIFSPFIGDFLTTSVTFTGEHEGVVVALQTITSSNEKPFRTYLLTQEFDNVDRVTWAQVGDLLQSDFHQFDDIVLGQPIGSTLETADLGPLGNVGGPFLRDDQFIAERFSLDVATTITGIGGHLMIVDGSIWGAIIPIDGPDALPAPDFDVEAQALASATFVTELTFRSEDLIAPVCQTLAPGHYALVFGGGPRFGLPATPSGIGILANNNIDIAPRSGFFYSTANGSWNNTDLDGARFLVKNPSPILPCPGDANGDLEVDFGDVTSVLGNWLNNYAPGTGPGDANGDGVVNFSDVTAVLGNWLAVCP